MQRFPLLYTLTALAFSLDKTHSDRDDMLIVFLKRFVGGHWEEERQGR